MTPADFMRPKGDLNPDWFESDLEATLAAALTEAAGEPLEARRAFAYWRAYETLVADLMARPASMRADDVSETRSDKQLEYWQAQAASWRARYEGCRTTVVAAVGVAL